MGLGVEVVAVAAPLLFVGEISGRLQLGDDPLGGTFGDADLCCEVTQPNSGRLRDEDEDPGVIGEKGPGSALAVRHLLFSTDVIPDTVDMIAVSAIGGSFTPPSCWG